MTWPSPSTISPSALKTLASKFWPPLAHFQSQPPDDVPPIQADVTLVAEMARYASLTRSQLSTVAMRPGSQAALAPYQSCSGVNDFTVRPWNGGDGGGGSRTGLLCATDGRHASLTRSAPGGFAVRAAEKSVGQILPTAPRGASSDGGATLGGAPTAAPTAACAVLPGPSAACGSMRGSRADRGMTRDGDITIGASSSIGVVGYARWRAASVGGERRRVGLGGRRRAQDRNSC